MSNEFSRWIKKSGCIGSIKKSRSGGFSGLSGHIDLDEIVDSLDIRPEEVERLYDLQESCMTYKTLVFFCMDT
jgi:hypothetical protein